MAKKHINTDINPFLRWAGGKRWLVSRLKGNLDINAFTSYHEPFVGGGAMLFSFLPKKAYISDANVLLMEAYKVLRDKPNELFDFLQRFPTNEVTYYQVRNMVPTNEVESAGRFIYLNRTSFNGIFRVNSKGEYNVPWGKHEGVKFDFDNLRKVSDYLQNVNISEGCDFEKCLKRVRRGALVFLDPPYTISNNINGFIKYNQKSFSVEDQMRLSGMVDEIRNRGAYYILTNANHAQVKEIFDKGDRIIELTRTSLIGGTNAVRGAYEECIFTNINITI